MNHPNICHLYDVGPDYLVMEFVEGSPVRALENTRRLLDIAAQIADGFAAAHAAGVIHSDLKPDNYPDRKRWPREDSRLRTCQASLPIRRNGSKRNRRDDKLGIIMGTVAYMSPEQVRGLPADHRSDIFSLGLILHELLPGIPVFQRDTSAETMTAILKEAVGCRPLPRPYRTPSRRDFVAAMLGFRQKKWRRPLPR